MYLICLIFPILLMVILMNKQICYSDEKLKKEMFIFCKPICGLFFVFLWILVVAVPVNGAPTTSLKVSVIENNSTVWERNLDYKWMEENLAVIGDGVTHYYLQGPVFQGDPWNPNESSNLRDMGAIKGTPVTELCNLSGGIKPGDEVMIKAFDGYHVQFDYDFLTSSHPDAGPVVIAWYNGAESGAGERQGSGYVPDYYTGMRLIICALENTAGKHVFGNTDMNKTLPSQAQYFYSGLYPSTGGLSAKWVDEVRIYRGGYKGDRTAPLKDAPVTSATQKSGESNLSLIIFCLGTFFVCVAVRRMR